MDIKVYSENMEKYLSFLADLKTADLKFHTHKVYNNDNYKMVLRGIHQVRTEWIKLITELGGFMLKS